MSFRDRLLIFIALVGPAFALGVFWYESNVVRQTIRVTLIDESGPVSGASVNLSHYLFGEACTHEAAGLRNFRGHASTGRDGKAEWHRATRRLGTENVAAHPDDNDLEICIRRGTSWVRAWGAQFGTREITLIEARCHAPKAGLPRCEVRLEEFDRGMANFRAFMYFLVFPQTAWALRLRRLPPRERNGFVGESWIVVFEAVWLMAFYGFEWSPTSAIVGAAMLAIWLFQVHRTISHRQTLDRAVPANR